VQGRRFRHEIDTNVISLNLKVLKEDAEIAAGDPVFCEKCGAVFNLYSKIGGDNKIEKEKRLEDIKEEVDEDHDEDMEASDEEPKDKEASSKDPKQEEDKVVSENTWICEFCNHKNEVDLEKEEIPTKESINYILENEDAEINKEKKQSEAALIFCVDISGSMCVTKPVAGKFKIKGDKYDELQKLMKFSDGSDQFAFKDRNVTYVSRLQCVQAAIESQLIEMKDQSSKRKVGLVSFNGDVNVVGDGTQISQVISGDKLSNYEYLLENGQNVAKTHLVKGIDETVDDLNEKLFKLEETGPTALGPAVASSIAMAGECGNGSTVVICTDGLANVGIGSLEEQKEDNDGENEVATFYENLGDYAKAKGITVNIISIKGEECDLETLSPLYEKTGGNVDIIEPDELKDNFANMLKNEVIATKVTAKIKLHKALEFRNEDESDLNKDHTLLKKELGNVTEESEITFEYRVKSKKVLKEMKDLDLESLKFIPFQTIIEYTKLDGMKCIRTITQVQQVTDDEDKVKENVKVDVLAVNAAQQVSRFAQKGNFREAQAYGMNQKRYIQK
jgi:Mg-chelatase subunit ChlD